MAQLDMPPLAPTSFGKKSSPWNSYTMFLVMALVALVFSVTFLFLEIRQFGPLFSFNGP